MEPCHILTFSLTHSVTLTRSLSFQFRCISIPFHFSGGFSRLERSRWNAWNTKRCFIDISSARFSFESFPFSNSALGFPILFWFDGIFGYWWLWNGKWRYGNRLFGGLDISGQNLLIKWFGWIKYLINDSQIHFRTIGNFH